MNREGQLQKLKASHGYDVIIIGGGATGLGCAVDAATRGLKTLLLEKNDFAKGTSSRATKLIHGGVRYLAQGNIRLVREALFERGRLLQNAPHVCHPLAFVVPCYSWWQKYYYGIGLWVYEFLSFRLSLGKTKLLSKRKTLEYLPDLSPQGLTGGVLYFDGQFDDSRLAINLAQTAVQQDATVLNYCGVTGFEKQDGKIVAVHAYDEINQTKFLVTAKSVINATGVFGDSILRMADDPATDTIAPSQGVHLVVDPRFFSGTTALMIPKTDDGRVLFVIPWHGKLLLGTTDTPVDKILSEPQALPAEIDFIISHFNRYTTATITPQDVESVFVGLRPLAKTKDSSRTSVMPRDHVIQVFSSGLVHVTGGKWTTYRNMAEHAIDQAVASFKLPVARGCQTKQLTIYGSEGRDQAVASFKLPVVRGCQTKQLTIHGGKGSESGSGMLPHLRIYGSDAIEMQHRIDADPQLAERVHPKHPYRIAEVQWCIENEMACTVEDVLARRIRLLFLDARAAIESAPVVASLMARALDRDAVWQEKQVSDFSQLARRYVLDET